MPTLQGRHESKHGSHVCRPERSRRAVSQLHKCSMVRSEKVRLWGKRKVLSFGTREVPSIGAEFQP